jgi:hypothetical protein
MVAFLVRKITLSDHMALSGNIVMPLPVMRTG